MNNHYAAAAAAAAAADDDDDECASRTREFSGYMPFLVVTIEKNKTVAVKTISFIIPKHPNYIKCLATRMSINENG